MLTVSFDAQKFKILIKSFYVFCLSVVPFSVVCFVVCFKRKHLLLSWMQTDLGRTVSRIISFLFLLVPSSSGYFFFCFSLIYDKVFPQISRDCGLCLQVGQSFPKKKTLS